MINKPRQVGLGMRPHLSINIGVVIANDRSDALARKNDPLGTVQPAGERFAPALDAPSPLIRSMVDAGLARRCIGSTAKVTLFGDEMGLGAHREKVVDRDIERQIEHLWQTEDIRGHARNMMKMQSLNAQKSHQIRQWLPPISNR